MTERSGSPKPTLFITTLSERKRSARDPSAPEPRKPACKLVGTDGNVFAIIGNVRRALRLAGLDARATEFVQKAFAAGSYDEVLGLCHEYVDVR